MGPQPPSALAIFVVAPQPGVFFVASFWCAIEPLIHAPEPVEAARVGGIRVVDRRVLEREGTHARPLSRECRRVGSRHRREAGCSRAGTLERFFAPVVVFDALALLLF